MSDGELKLEKIGRKPPTRAHPEDKPIVIGNRELRQIILSAKELRGAKGIQGDVGITGRRGRRGLKGERGEAGESIVGPAGAHGKSIQGPIGRQGEIGPRGPQGEIGKTPRHKWAGTKLSFEQPDGSFGRAVNLQGPGGGRGGKSANHGFSSIALVGTDLQFNRDKAGPLGPDIVVDLSPIAGGSGGFAGLGPWRYRTETTPNPSSGRLQFDNADPELATELYLNETNDDAEDLSNFIALLDAGDILYIQQKDNADNFIVVEISSNTDNGADVTLGIANIAQQGAALSQNTEVNLVATIAGGGAGSVVTGLVTAADGDDITLTQTSGGNQVADTSDFLWKLGKAGGQTARGGTLAGQTLTLQGSAHANRGRNILAGGATIDWDWTSDAVAAGGLLFENTIPASGGLVSALITARNNVTVNNGLFIMSALDDNSTLTWTVAPGFAVTTLFFARQNYRSSTNGVAPAQALIYAAQSQYWLTGAGDVTTINYAALSFAPIIRVDNSGDRMRITNVTGVRVNPLYNTRNANSTADFGTIRGTHMLNAAAVLFGQSLGAEIATAWIGLDVEALTGLTVSGRKAAVRSAITPATNNRFFENVGGANSDHGSGHIYFNDNRGVAFGTVGIAYDAWIRWASASNTLSINFFATGDDIQISSPAANRFLFAGNAGSGAGGTEFNFNLAKFSFGAQAGANGNQIGNFVAGAHTVTLGGEFSQFLLTQAANGTIDAALGGYFGWTINMPTPVLGTGSLSTLAALNIGGNGSAATVNRVGLRILSNPSGGSGINAALWITAGRAQFDGITTLPRNTDANRGAAGEAGRIIFNTDDGQLNIDDGTNWTLPDGTVT